jgi:hypothetical protein
LRGLDVKQWGLLDWIGVASFVIAALIPALNAALKDAPAVADKMPPFLSWAYLPLALMLITFAVILYRLFAEPRPVGEIQHSEGAPARPVLRGPIVGPFQIVNDPPAEFRLLPIHYSVDLAVPLPYVQAMFYGVNFLVAPITLTHARFSLRLFGAAPLEAIPLINEDFVIDSKFAPIVVFRRNLTDSEIRNLPWRPGRETASFELSAKATTGERTLAYVVRAMVMEGWVNGPPHPATKF